MIAEKIYLAEKLKEAGIKSQVYTSMKKLKMCSESHVGAVLANGETFFRSNSKKMFSGGRRVRLFDRETKFKVVIADNSEDNVEKILSQFLIKIGKGFEINGEWIGLEVGEADWVEEGDSILKSKVAVELEITFSGSIYVDRAMLHKEMNIVPRKEMQNEDN